MLRAEIIPVEPDAVSTDEGKCESQCAVARCPCIMYKIMRGFFFCTALCALFPGIVQGAEPEGTSEKLDSAVVSVSRAGKSTPVTYTMVLRDELRKVNPINSLPMALSLQPSVVAVNEGGTGLGYSKMTVRGCKGSQINVTLNGITLNDAESQEVFWVNIPALSGLLSSVQLQRGLGTSAAGPGAFGASINMSTASVSSEPYASADFGYGSYNTFTASAAAGTGLLRNGLYFDFAYSRGITDGYIRNAFARVQSAFAVAGWMNEKNSLRLTWLFGDQSTGITWNGITLEQYEADRRYNEAGEYYDRYGNIRYYDNDTDNYTQHHLQLNYTRQFGENVVWSTTFNWTKGDGYYENYKAGKAFSKYNFPSDFRFINEAGETFTSSSKGDFIVRKGMDNSYCVINSDVRYSSGVLNLTSGVNLSLYDGDHIGSLVWSDILGDSYDYSAHEWYFNNGLKKEASVFARAECTPLPWIAVYADLQYRGIGLEMSGLDDDFYSLDRGFSWHFFNPRAGLSFCWNPRSKAYVSAALGHREPGRSDIKENIKSLSGDGYSLKPEKMLDIEAGYSYVADRLAVSANIYLMEYWDMLLETGKLSDVGYAVKENVDRSWRRGVEVSASWQALKWLRADANVSLSRNMIRNYTEYVQNVDTYDNWAATGRFTSFSYGRTHILMSPSVTGMARLSFSPFAGIFTNSLRTTTLSLDGKYVGRQFLDNTMADSRSIPAYFVSGLALTHEFNLAGRDRGQDAGRLGLGFYVSNIFNNMYYADGWCWKNFVEEADALVDGIGIYPQAPANFMLKVSYRF